MVVRLSTASVSECVAYFWSYSVRSRFWKLSWRSFSMCCSCSPLLQWFGKATRACSSEIWLLRFLVGSADRCTPSTMDHHVASAVSRLFCKKGGFGPLSPHPASTHGRPSSPSKAWRSQGQNRGLQGMIIELGINAYLVIISCSLKNALSTRTAPRSNRLEGGLTAGSLARAFLSSPPRRLSGHCAILMSCSCGDAPRLCAPLLRRSGCRPSRSREPGR